ncbi:proton-translocating transhydrogenase family protein, partial [Nocardia sp. NPDC004711]
TLNVIGGFVVTDRMLGMFKAKKPAAGEAKRSDESVKAGH